MDFVLFSCTVGKDGYYEYFSGGLMMGSFLDVSAFVHAKLNSQFHICIPEKNAEMFLFFLL